MKKALRKEMLTQRKSLPLDEVKRNSEKITHRLLESELVKHSNTILIYMDFRNEVMTAPLITELWKIGKTVVIPRVNEETNELDLYAIEAFADMVLSSFGILEPNATLPPNTTAEQIDLVLAPGVCFDRRGYRMGYGGGFYDKLLPKLRKDCEIHALAFSMQLVDEVPTEPHDVRLNGIVTENEWIVSEN